jgi:DNA repair protein RecO (recombination protein O)
MIIHSTEAVILRHLDYGESDRIVTFLTAEHGLMKGFARGARKSRKRFGPALESFASVRLHWSASRGGAMVSLREAELLDLRTALRSDLSSLALAGYGCELLENLLGEGHGHGETFGLLRAFLSHLAAGGGGAEARLLFELRLVALAGYIPHLLHCSECGMMSEERTVDFDPSRGGALCSGCAGAAPLRIERLTLGTLARCLRTPFDLFEGFRFGPRTLEEGGRILSAALRLHLHRPLRSLAFLEEVLRAPVPLSR